MLIEFGTCAIFQSLSFSRLSELLKIIMFEIDIKREKWCQIEET